MPELILTILRLIFLALIYLFIWQVVRALARHIGYTRSDSTRKMSNRVTVVQVRFPGRPVVPGHRRHRRRAKRSVRRGSGGSLRF